MLCTSSLSQHRRIQIFTGHQIRTCYLLIKNTSHKHEQLYRQRELHSYSCSLGVWFTPLLTSIRHERSTTFRPRNSTWREKTEQHEKLQEELLNSEAAAKRRKQRERSLFAAREAAKASNKAQLHQLYESEVAQREAQSELLESLRCQCEYTKSEPANINDTNSNNNTKRTDADKMKRRTLWPTQLQWLRARLAKAISSDESSPEKVFNLRQSGVSAKTDEVYTRLFSMFKTRRMPFNPLHKTTKFGQNQDADELDPNVRINVKFLEALKKYHLSRSPSPNRKGNVHSSGFREKILWKEEMQKKNPIYSLTEEQQQEFVKAYARSKWYGILYLPFAHWTGSQIQRMQYFVGGCLLVLILSFIVASIYMYYIELSTFLQLSREDQRDYLHLVMGMRYSDIRNAWEEIRATEDPMHVLPLVAQCHELIEACRRKGWHKVDWSIELKKMHPHSALEEGDYIHLIYWLIMYIGRCLTGSGAFFESRFPALKEIQQRRETQEQYVTFIGDDDNDVNNNNNNNITINSSDVNESNDEQPSEQLPQPHHSAESKNKINSTYPITLHNTVNFFT